MLGRGSLHSRKVVKVRCSSVCWRLMAMILVFCLMFHERS